MDSSWAWLHASFDFELGAEMPSLPRARRPVPAAAPGAGGPGGDSGSELPDGVVLKMLQREVLLTRAKLHALAYEQAVAERRTRVLKSQLRQVRRALTQRLPLTLHVCASSRGFRGV